MASFLLGVSPLDTGASVIFLLPQVSTFGGHWIINRHKVFITNSACPLIGVTVIQAVTGKREDGKQELGCLIVPSNAPGLTVKERSIRITFLRGGRLLTSSEFDPLQLF